VVLRTELLDLFRRLRVQLGNFSEIGLPDAISVLPASCHWRQCAIRSVIACRDAMVVRVARPSGDVRSVGLRRIRLRVCCGREFSSNNGATLERTCDESRPPRLPSLRRGVCLRSSSVPPDLMEPNFAVRHFRRTYRSGFSIGSGAAANRLCDSASNKQSLLAPALFVVAASARSSAACLRYTTRG
jgi:hypothetical protein